MTIVSEMKADLLLRFGDTVRAHRTALGLSQEEFAGRAGVHRTYVGMVERGEKNITLRNIEKFSEALGVSMDQLFKAAAK